VRKKKSEKSAKSDGPDDESLVIIGGGTAGTYLAWRLSSADESEYNPGDIHLYERTDHVSGRLLSPTVGEDLCTKAGRQSPDAAHLPRTELGGMRVRTKDNILIGIMKELGIETGPFYMNADDETSSEPDTNPMYARNTLGTRADFANPNNMIPFKRAPQYFNESDYDEGPYSPAYDNAPNFTKISAEGFNPCDGATNKDALMQPYGPDGQPYYTYSITEAPHEFGGETADMVKFGEAISGYVWDNFDVGAAAPAYLGILPPQPYSYIRPLKGMEEIPHALHDAAVDLGIISNLNQEVTKLEQRKNRQWLVTFRETETSTRTSIIKMKSEGGIVNVVCGERGCSCPVGSSIATY